MKNFLKIGIMVALLVIGNVSYAGVVSYSRSPSGSSTYSEVTFSIELDSYTSSCTEEQGYDPNVDGWQVQLAIDEAPFEIYSDVVLGTVTNNNFVWDFYNNSFDISQSPVNWGITETANVNQVSVNCRHFGGNKNDIEGLEYTGSPLFTAELFIPPPPVYDCTDPEANNYNPLATIDDASCTYDAPINPIWGIIDEGDNVMETVTGENMGANVQYAGDNFYKPIYGSSLAILYNLRYWIVAIIIMWIIVSFILASFRYFPKKESIKKSDKISKERQKNIDKTYAKSWGKLTGGKAHSLKGARKLYDKQGGYF